MDIFSKIKDCDTMPKLDALRLEIVEHINANGNGEVIQKAFIKQQNKLKRKKMVNDYDGQI